VSEKAKEKKDWEVAGFLTVKLANLLTFTLASPDHPRDWESGQR
jgi:hypothetical protein